MVKIGSMLFLALFLVPLSSANPAHETLIMQAKLAIRSGNIVPERDLQPLLDALRSAGEDDQKRLIGSITELGRADGSSPAAVKQYFQVHAIPVFLQLAREGQDVFLRGSALHGLRDIGAPRSVLEQAAELAEKDTESYVQSRGEILRNYIQSMPPDQDVPAIRPVDPVREQAALEWLRKRSLDASPEQLRRSAQEGNVEAVKALMDAGVDANGPVDPMQSPLHAAVQSGCGAKGADNPLIVETVGVLLAAGANVNRAYDNGGNILFFAAQMCGPLVLEKLLAAGADMQIINRAGLTPLGLAILMQKRESAELLVQHGSTLNPAQAEMLSAAAADPEFKALVERAATAHPR